MQDKIAPAKAITIRPFIGAKDFEVSRAFYRYLGFEEVELTPVMSVFKSGEQAFYLQDYYAKEWVDNTMVFMEVKDAQQYYDYLLSLDIENHFDGARLVALRELDWGKECFVHDPSGVLWHFGEFN